MSARFFLKVLVVLVVAGGCFVYYFLSLKMTPEQNQATRLHRYAGITASDAVLEETAQSEALRASCLSGSLKERAFEQVRDV